MKRDKQPLTIQLNAFVDLDKNQNNKYCVVKNVADTAENQPALAGWEWEEQAVAGGVFLSAREKQTGFSL